jgi:hypothetical protein
MNWLQLAQRLSIECGIAGTGPSAVTGQTGMNLKLVNWIASAWNEIQGMYDNWGWMRQQFAFDTVASTGDYLPTATTNTLTGDQLTDLRYWWKDTLRCQKKSLGVVDMQWLVEWDYQTFRNTYRFNLQVNGRPVVFAQNPQGKAIMLGQIPDDIYEITGEYQQYPQPFVNGTDEPGIPNETLHLVIVYKAMQFYGLYEAAPEVLMRGNTEFSRLMNQLEREQLPELSLGNPLA